MMGWRRAARLATGTVLLVLHAAGDELPGSGGVVLRALRDELRRAQALRVAELSPPYFAAYSIHEAEGVMITASLGALLDSSRSRFRIPGIEVRVGSPDFDNSNYVLSDAPFGSAYSLGAMPIDDSYPVLRHYLWLATDRAYKSALEALARKRAALKNVTVSDQIPDFAKTEPVRAILPIEKETLDASAWEATLRNLSALAGKYPGIIDSSVQMQAVQGARYFANTEGTEVLAPEKMAFIRVKAVAQAPDGMILRDALVVHALRFRDLPAEEELRRGVVRMAEGLIRLCGSPVGEPYTGPVLFEAPAAAQVFAEVVGRNLLLRRRPVSEPGRPIPFVESEFDGRKGSRVLPEWMDVVDDPAAREWRGRRLFGYYEVDLEGVRPQAVHLIRKGMLENFLRTRQPVRDISGSNGHARLPGAFGARLAAFSNLIVRAAQTMSAAEMKKKMLDLCRERNKPYGIVVRKMDFPSSASLNELRRIVPRMTQPGGRAVSLPLEVVRLYPDGREEAVRGLRLQGLSAQSFRDILAAGDDDAVFDFLENGALFALMGMGTYTAESSVVAPSLLFEDVQLSLLDEELPKPPLVPAPSFAAR